MIALSIIASWILGLALVAGLCLAAHRGDLQQQGAPPARPASGLEGLLGGAALATVHPRESYPRGSAYPCNPPIQPADVQARRGAGLDAESPRAARAQDELALQAG